MGCVPKQPRRLAVGLESVPSSEVPGAHLPGLNECLGGTLHGLQGGERDRSSHCFNGISRPDEPGGHDHAHDAGLADQLTPRCSVEHGMEKARLEVLDLCTGVSETSDTHHRLRTYTKDRTFAQRQQRKPRRRDVLAQLAGRHAQALRGQFVQQLLVQQVNLPEVRLSGVFGYARAVFDGAAEVGVADDAVSLDQFDRRHGLF